MKYNVGQKVKVKSLSWYNRNKDKRGFVDCDTYVFFPEMREYCGKTLTIKKVLWHCYEVEENEYPWNDGMIDILADGPCDFINFNAKNLLFADKVELQLGDKWELVNENGRTYAVKKVLKFPTTYEECCEILNCHIWFEMNTCYHGQKLSALYRLLMCRDAYWKIAGDWKPDWKKKSNNYNLIVYEGDVIKDINCGVNHVLSFPTEEMRDAFYENFKDLIEQCKELL